MFSVLIHMAEAYHRRAKNTKAGQTMVEYGLLLALIAVVVIAVLLFLGPTIANLFTDIANNLNGTPPSIAP